MSIESWMKKHYPVTAQEAGRGSWTEAAQHSLAKWRGLTGSALREHGLLAPPVGVDASSCALCQRALSPGGRICCAKCPLAIARGGQDEPVPCTEETVNEVGRNSFSPWHEYVYTQDPLPMLRALEDCLSTAVSMDRKEHGEETQIDQRND